MSIVLKYLTISTDISEYKRYAITITNTLGFVVSYAYIDLGSNLAVQNQDVLTNKINKKILLNFKQNYLIKLFGYTDTTITLLGTCIIDNLLGLPANTIISTILYEVPEQTSILSLNASSINNFLIENFYLINNGNNNLDILGRLYFILSNDRNPTNAVPLVSYNMYGNNNMVYIKYCDMLTNKSQSNKNNINDFTVDIDNYNDTKILSPAFSYLTAYVESNISSNNYNHLRQLNQYVNFDSLIVRNYAFLNKMKNYNNQVYLPFNGNLINYALTSNCIYLKFINSYFVPDSFIERSLREVTFGHRENHGVFTDARYAPQPKVLLEFYILIVSSIPNSITLAFNPNKQTIWINKGALLFENTVMNNEIDIITVFNRPIKFHNKLVNYLSADTSCLIKNNDIVGYLK